MFTWDISLDWNIRMGTTLRLVLFVFAWLPMRTIRRSNVLGYVAVVSLKLELLSFVLAKKNQSIFDRLVFMRNDLDRAIQKIRNG